MSITQPIRSYEDVQKLKKYYLKRSEYRNYLLVSICLNTALRIRDVLSLKWIDLIDITNNTIKTHIYIREIKTNKTTVILINKSIKKAINLYIEKVSINGEYVFANKNGEKLSRIAAYNVIRNGGRAIGLKYEISCHSLRKTFGYHAWKNGTPPAILMQIYNHSSFEITKRYLGIAQDDKDEIYLKILL